MTLLLCLIFIEKWQDLGFHALTSVSLGQTLIFCTNSMLLTTGQVLPWCLVVVRVMALN
jgi:hypothetical protein